MMIFIMKHKSDAAFDLISRELAKRDITFSFEMKGDEYFIQSDQGQWTVDKALT